MTTIGSKTASVVYPRRSFGVDVAPTQSATGSACGNSGTQDTSLPVRPSSDLYLAVSTQVSPNPDAHVPNRAPASNLEGAASRGARSGSDRERRRGVWSLRAHRNPVVAAGGDRHFGILARESAPRGASAVPTVGLGLSGRRRPGAVAVPAKPYSGISGALILTFALSFLPLSTASADMLTSFVFHAPLQGADTWSTSKARQAGAVESNPLMGDGNALRMVVIKLPITLGISYLDHKIGQKSKRNQWIYRGAFVVGYGLLVRHNLKQGAR